MKLTAKLSADILYPFLRSQVVGNDDRKALMVAAIAKGIAYSLPLPSSEVVNLRSYYADNAEQIALGVLSDLNEVTVFDVRQAATLTYEIYRARYLVVHGVRSNMDDLLHRLVDGVVLAGTAQSLDPKFKGIFERIVESDSQDANSVAWSIASTIQDFSEGEANE